MSITRLTKNQLLHHFREIANKITYQISTTTTTKKKATELLNKEIISYKKELIENIKTIAHEETWAKRTLLEYILLITYTCDVVMLESRNEIWQYDYMSFSRRIGELWEPFCKLCFEFPLTDISLYEAPEFEIVESELKTKYASLVETVDIPDEDKENLSREYDLVWTLVDSGEIQLKSDLHFTDGTTKYVVDFKSGFGSNEKGNVNRLLLVGSIYKNILINDNYDCLIFVRSTDNNHYLSTLQNSLIWKVSCGSETYTKIKSYTGYDIEDWINNNVAWMDDFSENMRQTIINNDLQQYIIW